MSAISATRTFTVTPRHLPINECSQRSALLPLVLVLGALFSGVIYVGKGGTLTTFAQLNQSTAAQPMHAPSNDATSPYESLIERQAANGDSIPSEHLRCQGTNTTMDQESLFENHLSNASTRFSKDAKYSLSRDERDQAVHQHVGNLDLCKRTLRDPTEDPFWHFSKSVYLPDFSNVDKDVGTHKSGSCGQFAIASILAGLRNDVDDELFDQLKPIVNPDGGGVSTDAMISFLRQYFLVHEQERATVQQLQRQIDAGFPAVIVVKLDESYHWALVTGYSTDPYERHDFWHLVDNGIVEGFHSTDDFASIWRCDGDEHYQSYAIFIRPKPSEGQ